MEAVGQGSRAPSFMSQRFISYIFALLGVGILLPWNAFISARPYFQARLCGESSSSMLNNIEVWFSLVYNSASVLSLAALLLVQQYGHDRHCSSIRSSLRLSSASVAQFVSSLRISESTQTTDQQHGDHETWYMTMVSLSLYLMVFLITTISVMIPSIHATLFLTWTLLGLFVCGFCTSIASAGIIGTAGLFDPAVGIEPYFQGQAAGGLLVAIANVLAATGDKPDGYFEHTCQDPNTDPTLFVSGDAHVKSCVPYNTISWATMVYFFLGTLALGACMLGYSLIEKFKAERGRYSQVDPTNHETSSTRELAVITSERDSAATDDESIHGQRMDSFEEGRPQSTNELRRQALEVRQDSSTEEQPQDVTTVWNATKTLAYGLFNIYVVTLAIFPVLTSDLASIHQCENHNRLSNELYVPITFLVFNMGDFAGRFPIKWLSTIQQRSDFDRLLFWHSVFRWLFVPLFFLCYSRQRAVSISIHSDLFSFVVQFLFAYTNGMATSLCFSHAPTLVSDTEHMQQISSEILNFSLCSGLLLGSFLSYPLFRMFSGSW